MSTVAEKLDAARRELLDLGLRNPLLNYRPLKARGVEIVDERSADIYALLVENGRSLTFTAKLTKQPNPNELTQPEDDSRYTDSKLQTPYSSAALHKRLLTTAHVAHTMIEERGVNSLYLALGMLRWRDGATPDQARRAPLILIPVTLTRASANARYRLTYSDTEVSGNLSLEAKLRIDFGIELPLPAENELDVGAYFDRVKTAVSSQPHWQIDPNAITLAFFSFSKLLMLHDLDAANWPAGQQPADHVVLRPLLSDNAHFPPLPHRNGHIDAQVDLRESYQVIEADSSQLEAMLDVADGNSLVIQGPPGTGKSQTITNIIADAVGQGKRVLFVSEKMAALDVVKRRLDEVGIGDVALQLHSHRTTKAEVMAEIHRTMTLGQPKPDPDFPQMDELTQVQNRLNAHAEAANAPLGNSDTSPHDAAGGMLRLSVQIGNDLPPLTLPQLAHWTDDEFQQKRTRIAELETLLLTVGYPKAHSFYGTTATEAAADTPEKIRKEAGELLKAQRGLVETAVSLTTLLNQPAATNSNALSALLDGAKQLLAAPNLYAADIASPSWHSHAKPLRRALQAGVECHILREKYDEWLIPSAWQADLAPLRQPLRAHGGNIVSRLLSGKYRQARTALLGYCRTDLPDDPDEIVALVDGVLAYQNHQPHLETNAPLLKQLFGVRWQGIQESDWYELNEVGTWLIDLHDGVENGRFPPSLLAFLASGFDYQKQAELETAVRQTEAAQAAYQTELFDLVQFQLNQLPSDFAAQTAKISGWVQVAERFGEMVAFNQLAERLREAGLGAVVGALEDGRFAKADLRQNLTSWFDWHRANALVSRARQEREPLAGFARDDHETAVSRFRELDQAYLKQNRVRLLHQHWRQLPQFAPTGLLAKLHHESGKKRNHMPIRQLFTEFGTAVQQYKPVFMMSPLSIAIYLPPAALEFDLVVFDEASQVRPVEAFGAILRGRQAVVVGDSKQLPPTTFFDRVLGDGNADEPQFDDEIDSITASNESILDLFVDRGAPQKMLRSHYRSRHESLIALSNREFYDGQLRLFPSPDAGRRDLGLKLHYLPEAVYDRGKTRTNLGEAVAVAKAVMRHAAETPERTLGVAAFSTAQREAIALELEKLRRANPQHEPFFRAHPIEPFFVKNLENVQGDERDVILISIGYGKAADGSVSLNFGPLNGEGGERRLNVLITRARRRCELFTNLRAADIDLSRTESVGIAALKAYLAYAETGKFEQFAPSQHRLPSPFGGYLARLLQEHGYAVARHVGSNGVTVDVALFDPDEPLRFALGVQTGAQPYPDMPSARDRERTQPQVLAGLGWRIVRVWSGAWVTDQAAAEERLLTAVTTSLQKPHQPPKPTPLGEPIPRYAAKPLSPRVGEPYVAAAHQATLPPNYPPDRATPPRDVIDCLAQIVEVESPIHGAALKMRFIHAVQGLGKEKMEPVWRSAQHAVLQRRLVNWDGEFYFSPTQQEIPLRRRDSLPAHWRKFAYISDAELDAGLLRLVQDAIAIAPLELVPLTFTLFGYGNLSYVPQQRVFDRVVVLLENGRFHLTADQWVTLPAPDSAPATQAQLDTLKQKRPKYVSRKTKLDKLIEQEKVAFPEYSFFREPLFYQEGKWRLEADKGKIALDLRESCRFDPQTETYVERLPHPNFFSSRYQDIGVNDKETGEISALLGRVRYDLINGRFTHTGYLGAFVERTLRSDKLIRVWYDPTRKTILARRIKAGEEKGYKLYYFSHPTEQIDLNTFTLSKVEKTVLSNQNQFPISVAPEIGDPVTAFERNQFDALVTLESPIHFKLLVSRYQDSLGLKWPVVSKIVERLVADGVGRGVVQQLGEFVWWANKSPQPRNRAVSDTKWRNMQFVSIQEIEAAIVQILGAYQPLPQKLLVGLVGYLLLGKKRVGKKDSAVITAAIDSLKIQNIIIQTNQAYLTLSSHD